MKKQKKAQLRRKHRALRRVQAARERLAPLAKWFRKRKMEGLAGWVNHRRSELRERAKIISQDIRQLEREIEKLEQREGRESFLRFVRESVGAKEMGELHRKMCAEFNLPLSWPWCSIFVAYGLLKYGGVARDDLPGSLAYSGAWLTWGGAHRVSWADRQAGDLLIYDWGDGGMTDHVEVYNGDGQGIGGNESDPSGGAVKGPYAVPVGSLVGVVRVHW